MTAIDKLDFVLNAMNNYIDGHYLDLTEITRLSEILGKININELPSIINKLEKDGYVHSNISDQKDIIFKTDKKYMISFEGKLLNENGGYRYKKKRDSISASLQLVQTWAIALGTVLAGLYALYQIIIALTTSCQ